MENLSRSRHPNRVSRKACNGNGRLGGAKTMHDDIFAAPAKFGVPALSPRAEDYCEIFGSFNASRASSIPVLDLPEVDEAEVYFDVRNPGFDYSDVFGGFDGADFAASYEDLFGQSMGMDAANCSSEEAWTPAETESLSEESYHSEKDTCFSIEDPYQSFEGSTEFSISYQKASQSTKEDLSNGLRHTAEVQAVPGYSFLVNQTAPLIKTVSKNASLLVTDDANHNMEFTGGKQFAKATPPPPHACDGRETFGRDFVPQRDSKGFVTISEISLQTEPSHLPPPARPPPLLDVKKESSSRLTLNCKSTNSDGSSGDGSPPFFDVEVDASSSAAASAAAMKEAMRMAQAKMKSAKELMERKKEGFQGHIQPDSKSSINNKEGHLAKKSAEEKCGRGSLSSQGSDKIDGADEWKDSTQFFELVRTDQPRKAVEQTNIEQTLEHNAKVLRGQKENRAAMETCEQWGENAKKTQSVWPEYELKETKPKITEEDFDLEENNGRPKIAKDRHRLKEHENVVKMAQEVFEQEDIMMNFGMAQLHLETQKLNGAAKSRKCKSFVEDQQKFEVEQAKKNGENEHKLKEGGERRENEKNFREYHKSAGSETKRHEVFYQEDIDKRAKEALRQDENEKRSKVATGRDEKKKLKEARERAENEKRLIEALQQVENERRLEEALEQEENEKKLREAREREEKERRQRKTREREKNEKRLKEAHEREENEKKLSEAREWEEAERRQRKAREREENERRLKEAHEREENEKRIKEAREREENEKKLSEAREWEEAERRQRKAREREENERRLKEAHEREENEKRIKEAREKEEKENRLKEAREREENEKRLKEARERQENEKRQKEAREREENEKRLKEARERQENEKRLIEARERQENEKRLIEARERQENEKRQKEAREREENEQRQKEAREREENEKRQKEAREQEENDKRQKEAREREENEKRRREAREREENEKRWREAREREYHEKREKEARERKENEKRWREALVQEESVKKEPTETQERDDTEKRFDNACGKDIERNKASGIAQANSVQKTENTVESHILDGNSKNAVEVGTGVGVGQSSVNKSWKQALNQGENTQKFMSTEMRKECVDDRRKVEADQPAILEMRGNTQKTDKQVNGIRQSTVRKHKDLNETRVSEEKETDRVKRERELEQERLKKIEEEMEREREREKDRMAVDKATFEARESEREKTERAVMERATAEARQRALAEARERLEKACADAKEKSLPDKAAMEARLRAERAAVERATAEARERAAFGARERVERSVSDKFSSTYRNGGMRQSSSSTDLQDLHFQSVGSSVGSRNLNSSVSGASYFDERSEGVEGESAQRCRARLERHQRTAERAAKALAEKNMRDLLALREQAERNRLSETLDAEVKRWSSGKEGNLRALLSTLQYILGSDSGWQPVPLTEVITNAAVKKAYRKATLCVHPDKLQQRGANIQQKYICEKVFDLLKEAWNRFNSEER